MLMGSSSYAYHQDDVNGGLAHLLDGWALTLSGASASFVKDLKLVQEMQQLKL